MQIDHRPIKHRGQTFGIAGGCIWILCIPLLIVSAIKPIIIPILYGLYPIVVGYLAAKSSKKYLGPANAKESTKTGAIAGFINGLFAAGAYLFLLTALFLILGIINQKAATSEEITINIPLTGLIRSRIVMSILFDFGIVVIFSGLGAIGGFLNYKFGRKKRVLVSP